MKEMEQEVLDRGRKRADINSGWIKPTHGRTKTKTYKVWSSMRERCNRKNHKDYKNYGGRGITICPEWATFEGFLSEMGEKPDGYSIDRIDNNQGYSKMNCRWATVKQQQNNTRKVRLFIYRGKPMTIAEMAAAIGLSYETIKSRIDKGTKVDRPLKREKFPEKEVLVEVSARKLLEGRDL